MTSLLAALVLGLAAGIAAARGRQQHRAGRWAAWLDPLGVAVLLALLFAMGVRLGADPGVWEQVGRLGLRAAALAAAAVAGSVFAVVAGARLLGLAWGRGRESG